MSTVLSFKVSKESSIVSSESAVVLLNVCFVTLLSVISEVKVFMSLFRNESSWTNVFNTTGEMLAAKVMSKCNPNLMSKEKVKQTPGSVCHRNIF